ncbi:MAG: hypothetical protein ACLKAK_04755 [Alkaliphilus sp.]
MKRIISLILVFFMIFGTTVAFAGNSRTISRTEQMKQEQMKYEQALLSVEKQFAGQSEAFRESIKSAITESYLRRMSNQKHLGVVGEGETKTSFGVLSSNPFMSYNYTASVKEVARTYMFISLVSGAILPVLGAKFSFGLTILGGVPMVQFGMNSYDLSVFKSWSEIRGRVTMYWTDEVNFEYKAVHTQRYVFKGNTLKTKTTTWHSDFNE